MAPFVSAGAGFLLAVLWFDLMFDVQVRRHREALLPEEVLASIAAYYRRVTTLSRPMNRLVATVMLATLGSSIAQIADGSAPVWVGWAALSLTAAPVALAAARIVPAAVRLGGRADTAERQSALAREIFLGHLFCFASITALLAVELSTA